MVRITATCTVRGNTYQSVAAHTAHAWDEYPWLRERTVSHVRSSAAHAAVHGEELTVSDVPALAAGAAVQYDRVTAQWARE
jgi:hypothetical protein